MVRTLRRSPLDTNLTMWLSKCECSLQKSKRKRQWKNKEGAELKNKERKPNRIAKWKQGKPNKNMIQRVKME